LAAASARTDGSTRTADGYRRACVRIGQLSKELETAEQSKGGRHPTSGKPTKTNALAEAGLTTSSAQRYEAIERALSDFGQCSMGRRAGIELAIGASIEARVHWRERSMPDEFLERLGEITVAAAWLEDLLSDLIHALCGTKRAVVFTAHMSFSNKCDTVNVSAVAATHCL
jgi:hypothetical protein